jgi:hypothetical protein
MSKFESLALPVEKPCRMIITHPVTRQPLRSKDGVEAYIEVYSADSEVKRRFDREVTRRRLSASGRVKLTPEEIEAQGHDLLAALTAGWNLVGLDGEPIDVAFSPQAARELYATPAMLWLREQVDEFAADRGNFSRASSSN